MKELDLLKKDWQKMDKSFVQVSESDIYKMIHKRSSSIVKWIFIISILEFVVLNSLSYLIPTEKTSESALVELIISVLDYSSYGVALFFMYLFYRNYRSITVTSNTKKLMECILNTRKTVRYYIIFNLVLVFVVSVVVFFNEFQNEFQIESANANTDGGKMFFICMLMLLFIAILIGVVWLFYQLIYGILLKRLNRNYVELRKIDL